MLKRLKCYSTLKAGRKDSTIKMDKYDDIYSFLGKKFRCSYCSKEHYIPTEIVESGKDAVDILPLVVEKISNGRNILLLADDITYAVAGQKIQAVFLWS